VVVRCCVGGQTGVSIFIILAIHYWIWTPIFLFIYCVLTIGFRFEEGTSLAVSSLCKIFCFSLDRRFSPTYLSLFCFSLNKILQKDISDKVLISILVNTRQLFTQQIEGINVLIPAYLFAFSRVWVSAARSGCGIYSSHSNALFFFAQNRLRQALRLMSVVHVSTLCRRLLACPRTTKRPSCAV